MCYIASIASRTRQPAYRPPWVPVKTSNRGVAVPRAGCVTKKAYKEYFEGFEESRRGHEPGCIQGPCPGVREGFPENNQGFGCQVLKKQKKLNAKQDCKNCRESDRFEGRCFEGYRLQACCSQACCPKARSEGCCAQGARQGPGRRRQARRCREAGCYRKANGCRAARRREEAVDPASGLQDPRIRGVSGPWRRPDPRHRGAGDRRREA